MTKGGKKIRLHFTPGGGVNEAKNLSTGKTHTPADFAADRRRGRRPTKLSGQAKRKRIGY